MHTHTFSVTHIFTDSSLDGTGSEQEQEVSRQLPCWKSHGASFTKYPSIALVYNGFISFIHISGNIHINTLSF